MLISANSGYYSARPNAPRFDMINEAVDFLADTGFQAIDVNFCAVIYNSEKKPHEPILDAPENLPKLAKKIKERGLAVNTTHLPFFDYTAKDNPKYEKNQEMVYKSIDASAYLGAKWAVIHTAVTSEDTVEYVRPLCKYANEKGLGIAIENSPRSTIEALCKSIDTLRSEGYTVGCCYDTGHANYAGLSQGESVRTLGERIKMLHVHDNYGDRDAHQSPYAGNINWTELMKALAEVGYEGDFNYEIQASNLPESVRKAYAEYDVALAKHFIGIYEDEKLKLENSNN